MNEHYSSKEKFLATLAYLSGGIIGFILLLLKKDETHFLKYHIYQSIVLGLVFLLLNSALAEVLSIISKLMFFSKSVQSGFVMATSWLLLFLQAAEFALIIYCMITVWRNKYTWIKWISAQIYKML
jgi:uncharacterized membrane protein